MAVLRIDHVGINVDDLEAATAFFVALGFEASAPWTSEGPFVEGVVGLDGARSESVMLTVPGGQHQLELSSWSAPADDPDRTPAPAHRLGIRHIALPVDDLDEALRVVRAQGYELVGRVERYEDIWRLCFVRGPEGIIVELAEALGG